MNEQEHKRLIEIVYVFDGLATSIDIRLGPSASQVGSADNSKVSEMLKAITFLQQAMQEPWAQKLMGGLNIFTNDQGSSEMTEAVNGLPAPSRPKHVPSAPVTPNMVEDGKKVDEVPPKDPDLHAVPPTAPAVPVVPPKGPKDPVFESPVPEAPAHTINSSSHRAAHARLSRKMASLSEVDCPNMHKLWAGSRKDPVLVKPVLFSMLCYNPVVWGLGITYVDLSLVDKTVIL